MKKRFLFSCVLTSLLVSCSPSIATSLKTTYSEHNIQSNTSDELVTYFIDHPDRILWKGWTVISRTEIGSNKAYCMVTDDDKLFLFSHRPSAQSLDPAVTIDLSEYSFVESVEDNPSTFILSSINPYVEKRTSSNTLIFQLASTRADKKHIDLRRKTLQDLLFDHLKRQKIDTTTLQKCKQWLKDNEIYEDAIKQDIEQPKQSNLQYHFPAICKEIQNFVKKHPEEKLSYPSAPKNPIHYQPLLNTLRYATHQYYLFEPSKKDQEKGTFHLLQKDTAIDTTQHHLIQLTCQVERPNIKTFQDELFAYLISHGVEQDTMHNFQQWLAINDIDDEAIIEDVSDPNESNIKTHCKKAKYVHLYKKVHAFIKAQSKTIQSNPLTFQRPTNHQADMYCYLPKTYHATYQGIARFVQDHLRTDVHRLTRYGRNDDLSGNASKIFFHEKEDHALTLSLAPFMQPIQIAVDDTSKSSRKTAIQASNICPNLLAPLTSEPPKYPAMRCPIYQRMHREDPVATSNLGRLYYKPSYFSGVYGTYVGSFARPNKEDLQHLKECDHGELPPCPYGTRCPALEKLKKDKTSIDKQLLITYRSNHKRLFSHPPKQRKLAATHEEQSPFSYEANFAKMHSFDLRAIDPLEQLQDPRLLLKALVMEAIENNVPGSSVLTLAKGIHLCNLKKYIKYITANEFSDPSWLEKVKEKMNSERHRALGSPLNIAEMFALYLYTDFSDTCYDLGKAQRSDNFDRWPIWDQCLMRAILKLHQVEIAKSLKTKARLYSGLQNVQLDQEERIGFFKSYTSTSQKKETAANTFMQEKGMLMYLQPSMCRQFLNCDVDWISGFSEGEILFARSADIGLHPAPKWKATVHHYLYGKDQQHVNLIPAFSPLIVRKGKTNTLPAHPFHKFSYIKIEENATLTIAPWQPNDQQGGRLQIHCFGACILEKNAKIDVSGKGYAGGTRKHPKGYGKGGGHSSNYCAAGGSYTTQGGSGQCQNAFKQITYHAKRSSTYGHTLLTSKELPLGSGGGYIRYDSSEGTQGSRGGGALYLEVRGDLHLGNGAQFLADGEDADPLSGGAGSGGSICIKVNGDLIQATTSIPHFSVQGGNTFHRLTQGKGGHGKITLYIAQHEKIITYWLRKYDHIANAIKPYIPIITTFLLNHQASKYPLSRKPSLAPTKERMIHSMQNLFSSQKHTLSIDHITVSIHYHNAQGIAHTAQAHYQKAVQYHDKALELAQSKYGIKQPHLDIANAYAHKGQTLEAQGNYQAAIAAHQKELKIVRQVYKQDPSHPKVIQAHTHLSIAYQGQGQDELAKKALNNVITTWEKNKKAQSRAAIATAYDQRGVAYHHQGNYPKAMNDHIEAQKIRTDLHGHTDHLDLVASYQYIGQAHHDQGNTSAAIDFYNKALKMLKRLYPSQANRPDMAAIHTLLGKVYHSQGQYKQAIASQEKALRMYKEVYHNQNHPDIADVLYYLALSYHGQGDYDLATYYYQKAIETLQVVYRHRDILDALFSYLIQQGIAKEGAEQFKQWLQDNEIDDEALIKDLSDPTQSNIKDFDQKTYTILYQLIQTEAIDTLDTPLHPTIADALDNQGSAYTDLENYKRANEKHQKAYIIRKLSYQNPSHPKLITSYSHIALVYHHQDKPIQALSTLNKAINLWEKHKKEQAHPSLALAYHHRGLVHDRGKNYPEALQDYEKSIKMNTQLYGKNPHPAIATCHHHMGDTYAKEKKYLKALKEYQTALDIRQKIYDQTPHPNIATSLSAIGATYANLGKPKKAIEQHAKATQYALAHYRKENQIDHDLTLYVAPNASRKKELDPTEPEEKQIHPLDNCINDFLYHSDATLLLLQGDAGAGKSLYGRYLEKQLWEKYQAKQSTMIPLFLSLPGLQDPKDSTVVETQAMEKGLKHYGWDAATIQALKKQSKEPSYSDLHPSDDDSKDDEKDDEKEEPNEQFKNKRMMIFLDGYDEIRTKKNLYQTNNLAQWGAKIIISCRTEYLEELGDYHHAFPADKEEWYIRPFNKTQISSYLANIESTAQQERKNITLDDEEAQWTKEQYTEAFAKQGLQNLMASPPPFILQMVVKALPQLQQAETLTRTDIYQAFIEH